MMKRWIDFLAGIPMTIISGLCLGFSLTFSLTDINFPIDPAWISILISGIPMLYLALTRLLYNKWISSALLISIAMVASMAIGEIFAAGEVAFIMAIGAILEDMTVARAKKGLSNLIALTPTEGRKLTKNNGSFIEQMIPADKICVGDLLRVLPGEKIPVDGRIVTGNTSIDQSIITGESLPLDKGVGEEVFCGTLNCYGSIDIKATNVGKDSSLQKLIDIVAQAEEKKAPMQRIADQWSVWLVPIALGIAIAAFFVNWALGYEIMQALNRCVTVLVVFCPCALALATPVSIMAAIGQATKHGVIIKSGEALERMGKIDTIAFDKTGTLTYGKLEVSDVISFTSTVSTLGLLQMTASAEMKSEHPLAKAIVSFAKTKELTLTESDDFQMVAGKGIQATVDSAKILCGNKPYLVENQISLSDVAKKQLEALSLEGKACILVARNQECIGVIALSDVLREQAKEMIDALSVLRTKTLLLTGDSQQAGNYFAKQVGISEVKAQLLPTQKMDAIAHLQESGRQICMIGDGINDAPALKTANVGIAMGTMGSDIAIEAADIALMGDDISKIPYLKKLSRSTLNTIRGNITVSMCINFIAVTMAVLGLLNPVTGALVHNAGSVLVVLNAALLYDRKLG
jgi:heavy metal translocating P-type ATPase